MRPLLALGWTLNYEMFFYLLFAGTLVFAQGRALWLLATAMLGLVAVGWLLHPQFSALTFWTSPIILEFLYGCGLGYLFAKTRQKRSPLAFPVLVLLGMALYYLLNYAAALPLDRSISHGLPAVLIVFAVVFYLPDSVETRLRSVGRFLGDSSYSLYLSHPFSLAVIKLIWPFQMSFKLAILGFVPVATLFAILIGRLCFTLLERPALRLLRRGDGALPLRALASGT